jgi:anhydro-N-acetylmuramic acid kinase
MQATKPAEIYIGLMSGTSLDGVDIAIVDFARASPKVLFSATHPYSSAIKARIRDITLNQSASIDSLCQLDIELGKVFADVVNHSLAKASLFYSQIEAIGCHGQTIRHQPDAPFPYTLQSGDPNTLAAETGITTIADFRRRDIALGGQGAPLAPAFHQFMFRSTTTNRAIINIGGIANLTYLPTQSAEQVIGFDTGPGNTLSDYWVGLHKNKAYDDCGQWAKSGHIIIELLDAMLSKESYFKLTAPKSTGTDYFNSDWLTAYNLDDFSASDIQATLIELTALSIASGISQLPYMPSECFVCGGGAHNLHLLDRIQKALPKSIISTTEQLKIDPDYVEAIAFAWLARQRMNNLPGNIPSATHASNQAVLGGIYSGDLSTLSQPWRHF